MMSLAESSSVERIRSVERKRRESNVRFEVCCGPGVGVRDGYGDDWAPVLLFDDDGVGVYAGDTGRFGKGGGGSSDGRR